MGTYKVGNISGKNVVVGDNNVISHLNAADLDCKILLLKILRPEIIGIKPTKRELLRNLVENYGFDLESANRLIASLLREGLIEMDSFIYRIGLTNEGFDRLNKYNQNNGSVNMNSQPPINEFYAIADLNIKPLDDYQLENLGFERVYASGVRRESQGGGKWETKVKVKSEDYDGVFALKITRVNPPYELGKLIDHHFNYYTHKGGERDKFLSHMRYVILPYLQKWHSNYPAHAELTQKWIETAEKTKVPMSEAKKPALASHFERMVSLGITPFDLRNPVYKYRTIQSAIDILQTNKIYFPTSNQLNDKLELHPSILDLSFTKETKERYLAGFTKRNNGEVLDMSDDQFYGMMQDSIEFFKNNVGILSTAKTSTNSSVWEHYGNNHKGVCLGFVIPQNAFGTHLSFNVRYTDQPQKIKLIDDSEGDITYDIFYWFCIKQQSFSFEEEVRIIDDNGFGLRPFDKKMLFEIIMGRDTTDHDYQLIAKAVTENGYPVKRIGKIAIKPDTFGLSIETIKQFT